MLAKFRSHPHLGYFIAYCITFLIHGIHITALGPYIPFIAARTGLVETEYSYLFTCRSAAMIAGALVIKWFQTRPAKSLSNHRIMATAALFITAFALMFGSTIKSAWLGLWMLLTSFFYSFIEINNNVCGMMINPIQDMEFFLLILHGLFATGGLLGPVCVAIFKEETYLYIGLMELITAGILLSLPSPETIQLETGTDVKKQDTNQTIAQPCTPLVSWLLGSLLFFFLGMEFNMSDWLSSYSILVGSDDKQSATIYPSIFWILQAVIKFVVIYIPGTTNQKMARFLELTVVSCLLTFGLVAMGLIKLACFFVTITLGVTLAPMYPLVYALPSQFNIYLEDHQVTNITIFSLLAEGVITTATGVLMHNLGVHVFLVSFIMVAIVMWLNRLYCVKLMTQQPQSSQKKLLETQLVCRNPSSNKRT